MSSFLSVSPPDEFEYLEMICNSQSEDISESLGDQSEMAPSLQSKPVPTSQTVPEIAQEKAAVLPRIVAERCGKPCFFSFLESHLKEMDSKPLLGPKFHADSVMKDLMKPNTSTTDLERIGEDFNPRSQWSNWAVKKYFHMNEVSRKERDLTERFRNFSCFENCCDNGDFKYYPLTNPLPSSSDQSSSGSDCSCPRRSEGSVYSPSDVGEEHCSEMDTTEILTPIKPYGSSDNVLNVGLQNNEFNIIGLIQNDHVKYEILNETDDDVSDFSPSEDPVYSDSLHPTLSDSLNITHKYTEAHGSNSQLKDEDYRPTVLDRGAFCKTLNTTKTFNNTKPLSDLFHEYPSPDETNEIPIDRLSLNHMRNECYSLESPTVSKRWSFVNNNCGGGDFTGCSEGDEDFCPSGKSVNGIFSHSKLADASLDSLEHEYTDTQGPIPKIIHGDSRPTTVDTRAICEKFYKIQPLTNPFHQFPTRMEKSDIPIDCLSLDHMRNKFKGFETPTIQNVWPLVEDECDGDYLEDAEVASIMDRHVSRNIIKNKDCSVFSERLQQDNSSPTMDKPIPHLGLTTTKQGAEFYERLTNDETYQKKDEPVSRMLLLTQSNSGGDFYEHLVNDDQSSMINEPVSLMGLTMEKVSDDFYERLVDNDASSSIKDEPGTNNGLITENEVDDFYERLTDDKASSIKNEPVSRMGLNSEIQDGGNFYERVSDDSASSRMNEPVPYIRLITESEIGGDFYERLTDNDASSSIKDEPVSNNGIITANQGDDFYERLSDDEASSIKNEPVSRMGLIIENHGGGDFYGSFADDEASSCSSDDEADSSMPLDNLVDWTEDDYEHENFGHIDYPTDDEFAAYTSFSVSGSIGSQSEEEEENILFDGSMNNSRSTTDASSSRCTSNSDASSITRIIQSTKLNSTFDYEMARWNCCSPPSSSSTSNNASTSVGSKSKFKILHLLSSIGGVSSKSESISDGGSSMKRGSCRKEASSMESGSSKEDVLTRKRESGRKAVSSSEGESSSDDLSSRKSDSRTYVVSLTKKRINGPQSRASGSNDDVSPKRGAIGKDGESLRTHGSYSNSSRANQLSSDSSSSKSNRSGNANALRSNKSCSYSETSGTSESYSDSESSGTSGSCSVGESSGTSGSCSVGESSGTSGSYSVGESSGSSGSFSVGESSGSSGSFSVGESSETSASDSESSGTSGSYSDDASSSISKFRMLEESSHRDMHQDWEESLSTSGSWTCDSSSSSEPQRDVYSSNQNTHEESLGWEDISSEIYDSSTDENLVLHPLISSTDED